MKPDDVLLVTQAVVARWCRITKQRVSQLVQEGVFVEVGGKLDLMKCVQAWHDSQTNRAGADSQSARNRLMLAKAEAGEMANRERRGELVSLADVQVVFAEACIAITSEGDALAARYAPKVAVESEVAICQRIIDDEWIRIRNATADRLDNLVGLADRPQPGGKR